MRNNFLKIQAQNVVEKLFPEPLKKIKIEHISGSIVSSFIQFFLIVCHVLGYRNILKISSSAFTSYKAFLKTKEGLKKG